MSSYRFDKLETLIEKHIWENDRIDAEDRKTTQRLIEQELRERTERLIRVLRDTQSIQYDLKNRNIEEEVTSIMRWVVDSKAYAK